MQQPGRSARLAVDGDKPKSLRGVIEARAGIGSGKGNFLEAKFERSVYRREDWTGVDDNSERIRG